MKTGELKAKAESHSDLTLFSRKNTLGSPEEKKQVLSSFADSSEEGFYDPPSIDNLFDDSDDSKDSTNSDDSDGDEKSQDISDEKQPKKDEDVIAVEIDLGRQFNPNRHIKPRAYFISNSQTTRSIFYEEQSKQMGMPKGYTTVNEYYHLQSEKNLFACYDDYVINNKQQGIEILPFPHWAEKHFAEEKAPATWKKTDAEWKQVKLIYQRSNLVSYTAEQRSHLEARFINGVLHVKKTHPHKIFNPLQIGKIIKGVEWMPANSHFGPITSRRGAELIYILAEEEGVIDQKTQSLKKILYLVKDMPGVIHHTSIIAHGVLAGGTLTVGLAPKPNIYNPKFDGTTFKLTAQSGHFRNIKERFFDVVLFFAENKAYLDYSQCYWYSKKIDTVTNQVVVFTHQFSSRAELNTILGQRQLVQLRNKIKRLAGTRDNEGHAVKVSLSISPHAFKAQKKTLAESKGNVASRHAFIK